MGGTCWSVSAPDLSWMQQQDLPAMILIDILILWVRIHFFVFQKF